MHQVVASCNNKPAEISIEFKPRKEFMKNIFFINVLSFVTALTVMGSGKVTPDCPEKLEAYDNIQIQQSLSGDGQTCYLSIHPRDAFETLIYRDYLLTSDGLLMVFNSYSASEEPAASGAREFYFLNQNFKEFRWKTNGSVLEVTGLDQMKFEFSLTDGQVTGISGAKFTLDKDVNPNNKGGLEIASFNGIFLDVGFRIGNSPSMESSRKVKLENSIREKCWLRNHQIFEYQDGDSQIISWALLQKQIKKACPQFKMN